MKNEVWIAGPVFLSKPEREWPDKHDHLEELTAEDPEVKKGILVNATTAEESTDAMQQLIQYYSSWIHLKKAVKAHTTQGNPGKPVKEEKGDEWIVQ